MAATAVIKLLVCGLWGPLRWCEFNLVGYKLLSGMTDGFKFSVVTFSIFHLGLCFKTFHFACTPRDRGVVDITPLSLTRDCFPLNSQLLTGSPPIRLLTVGTLWTLSALLLPQGHQENQSCVSQGSVNTPGKHSCCSPYLFGSCLHSMHFWHCTLFTFLTVYLTFKKTFSSFPRYFIREYFLP